METAVGGFHFGLLASCATQDTGRPGEGSVIGSHIIITLYVQRTPFVFVLTLKRHQQSNKSTAEKTIAAAFNYMVI